MEWYILNLKYRAFSCFVFLLISGFTVSQDCDNWSDDLDDILRNQESETEKLESFKSIVQEYKDLSCDEHAANTWRFIGDFQWRTNDYVNAKKSFQRSLGFAQKSNDDLVLASSLNMMGFIFDTEEEYDSCYYYFNEALKSFVAAKDTVGQMITYRNLASALYQLDDYQLALYYTSKLESLAIITQDQNNLNVAQHIRSLINADSIGVSNNSIEEIQKVKEYYKADNDLNGLYSSNENLGYCFEEIQNYDSAIYYYQQASSYADSTNSLDNIRWMNAKVTDLSLLVQEQNKNRLIWIYGLGMAVIILIASGFLYYRNRQQRALINDQKIDELMSDKEIDFMDAQIQGQEAERKRLAEELHDRLGGMLAALKIQYGSVEEGIDILEPEVREKYQKANELLSETTQEVRRISHDLHEGVVSDVGLVAALKDLQQTLEGQKEIEFNWYFNNMEMRMNSEVEINVFRMILESIANILKHSKAKEVTVQLCRNKGELNVMIEDDGKGFDANDKKKKKGLGLRNIQARAERLNGKLTIDSSPGRGTISIIDIPIL